MSNAKHISLGDDFGDVVITANRVQVEIHRDGSVVSNFAGLSKPAGSVQRNVLPPVAPTWTEPVVPTELFRIEKAAPGSALRKLIESAEVIARKFGHPEITYMHVAAAIFDSVPDIAQLLGPKMKPDTMKRLVEKELGSKPRNLAENAPVTISPATAVALAKADWVTEKSYKSDRLLPLEALRGMVIERKVPRDERCATVDYAYMIFSGHSSLDVGFETRKAIDRIASSLGEVKPATPPPPGIQLP